MNPLCGPCGVNEKSLFAKHAWTGLSDAMRRIDVGEKQAMLAIEKLEAAEAHWSCAQAHGNGRPIRRIAADVAHDEPRLAVLLVERMP